jgi:HEAT repeat protein
LTRIGPATVPELRRWLADPNPEVRRHAANLLGRIGPKAFDAIPDLIIMLDDENANVRKHAARALGQIGPSAAESSPALLRILREEILKEQALGHPGR